MEKPLNPENSTQAMNTLSQILNKLRSKGYDNELKFSDHGRLQSSNDNSIYDPSDLTIIKTYRFEGDSDPSDSSVLYIMEDKKGNKGYVIDAYGAYTSHDETGFDEFIQKIPVEDREEQFIFGGL
ncbi:hypothetical protein LX64_03847 [Chitinophaga skermanii]|uniref:Phosphoribosylpyrophosphate synthetase n=1 Tax=Chitinophaga skermanii TaxID=331697 RepID=A0A327QB25_9BACT|nr:hypothetical protein [Chitinophaga skermanii]RAJ01630.1 hypothetical protein LX64_03847 [Chitinophaga skermanii]